MSTAGNPNVLVDRDQISAAYARIAPYIRRTPLIGVDGVDFGLPGLRINFKLESMQLSGSFKVRGAFTNLVTRTIPSAGVAAASGGNHGAAVAYAAMRRGVRAKIFVPTVSSPVKIERIRSYGADLVITGERYGDTVGACEEYCAQSGALNIHAFDQYETMQGTGTVGLEVSEQLPDVDTVLVGVGGGGLIAGIAAWFAGSGVRVIGVEPREAPTLTRALEAGQPVDAPTGSIANDSLAPKRIGDLVFPIVRPPNVERVLLVEDDEIRASQRALWSGLNVVAEPGGAAAFAALLSKRYVPGKGEHVCVIVSGGNSAGEA